MVVDAPRRVPRIRCVAVQALRLPAKLIVLRATSPSICVVVQVVVWMMVVLKVLQVVLGSRQ